MFKVVESRELPVLVFDGECGFCTWCAERVERHWDGRAQIVPWQHLDEEDLAHLDLTASETGEAAWWVDACGRRYRGARAIGKALMATRGLKRWIGAVCLVPPASWLAAVLYLLVVRLRHRLPGAAGQMRLGSSTAHRAARRGRRTVR